MDVDDDMPAQRKKLIELFATIEIPAVDQRTLGELCYTVNETGAFNSDDAVNPELALRIWGLVELAKKISAEDLKAVRM